MSLSRYLALLELININDIELQNLLDKSKVCQVKLERFFYEFFDTYKFYELENNTIQTNTKIFINFIQNQLN